MLTIATTMIKMYERHRSSLLLAWLAVGLLGCVSAEEPVQEPTPPPTPIVDGLRYVAAAEGTPDRFQPLDMVVIDGVAWICTSPISLARFDVSDASSPSYLGQVLFDGSADGYPGCTWVEADGDRLFVVSRRTEMQPEAFVAMVDTSDPAAPTVLAELSPGLPLEEAAVLEGTLFVAAHDEGIRAFVPSSDALEPGTALTGLGNVTRLRAAHGELVAGTTTGTLHFVDGALEPRASLELGAPILDVLPLGDDRVVVALGSAGLALVDPGPPQELDRVSTGGTAVRLEPLEGGRVLVANWSDLRVYDGWSLSLEQVDGLAEAGPGARILTAAAVGDLVIAGEWHGLHTLVHAPGAEAPDLAVRPRRVTVPADGSPHDATVDLLNEGQLPLEVRSFDVPPGWATEATPPTLAPGEVRALPLSFSGSTEASDQLLTIESPDPDEPQLHVALLAGAEGIGPGEPAPPLTSTGLNTGQVHDLESQQGRVVLLSYFGLF